jgi:threonine/homoserine/homoserine lactone efflux protein
MNFIRVTSFSEGLIAGYGIAIPVGAVAILIVSTGMQCGFKIGFMAGAGTAAADFLYAIIASVAGAVLVTVLEPIASGLRIISALVLISLAGLGLRRGLKRSGSDGKTAEVCGPVRMFGQFLGITIINPLTIVYFTALILGRDSAAVLSFVDQVAFVIGVGLASLSWQTLLAGLGSIARSHLPARFQLSAVIFGNLLIMGLGLQILFKTLL